MKVCPHDPSHTIFVTTATVQQLWIVDKHGEFIECLDDCIQVYHKPNPENIWECLECGHEAVDFSLKLIENKEENNN